LQFTFYSKDINRIHLIIKKYPWGDAHDERYCCPWVDDETTLLLILRRGDELCLHRLDLRSNEVVKVVQKADFLFPFQFTLPNWSPHY